MPFCLREASCASAFCFAFGAIWRRWRSIARVQASAASWRLSGANAATARSKRRSAKAVADESAIDLAKLVWLLLLAAAHGAALCGAPMLCERAGGPRRLLEYLGPPSILSPTRATIEKTVD